MDKKQEEFEQRPIQPIAGQMCYDELLLPEIEEEKEKIDTSVAEGQIDLWHLPPVENVQNVESEKHENLQENLNLQLPKIETLEEQKIEEKAKEISFESVPKKSEKPIENLKPKLVEEEIKNQHKIAANETERSQEKLEIEKEAKSEIEADFSAKKQQDVFEELNNESENNILEDTEIADNLESEEDEEFVIDFENPPKKLEKSEINASKTHFFGNYENPFDE